MNSLYIGCKLTYKFPVTEEQNCLKKHELMNLVILTYIWRPPRNSGLTSKTIKTSVILFL